MDLLFYTPSASWSTCIRITKERGHFITVGFKLLEVRVYFGCAQIRDSARCWSVIDFYYSLSEELLNFISSPSLEGALRKGPFKKKKKRRRIRKRQAPSAGVTWIFQPSFGELCPSPFSVCLSYWLPEILSTFQLNSNYWWLKLASVESPQVNEENARVLQFLFSSSQFLLDPQAWRSPIIPLYFHTSLSHSATWWLPLAITAGQKKKKKKHGLAYQTSENKTLGIDHTKEIKWLIEREREKKISFRGTAHKFRSCVKAEQGLILCRVETILQTSKPYYSYPGILWKYLLYCILSMDEDDLWMVNHSLWKPSLYQLLKARLYNGLLLSSKLWWIINIIDT